MSEDAMRERFHDLGQQREEILAVSGPLRAERDALLAEYEPRVRELEKQTRDAEKGLFEIDQERAALARALKGKTGAPPAREG